MGYGLLGHRLNPAGFHGYLSRKLDIKKEKLRIGKGKHVGNAA